MRVLYYIIMAALQDEETQIRGTVIIIEAYNQKRRVPSRAEELWKSWVSSPWRVAALHSCLEDCSVTLQSSVILANLMEAKHRCRVRIHRGEYYCMIEYNLLFLIDIGGDVEMLVSVLELLTCFLKRNHIGNHLRFDDFWDPEGFLTYRFRPKC